MAGVHKDFSSFVYGCEGCQKATTLSKYKKTLHFPITPPFGTFSVEFAGTLLRSGSRKKYVLVAVEHLTCWPPAKPTATSTADEVVKYIEEEIVYSFGSPSMVVSDNATCSTDAALDKLMKKHGIEWKPVLAYAAMLNGRPERMIGTLRRSGRKIIISLGSSRSTWEAAIQTAVYGNRRRASTGGSSPFQSLYGVPPRMTPLDKLPPLPTANFSHRDMELIHVAAVRAERSHTCGKMGTDWCR